MIPYAPLACQHTNAIIAGIVRLACLALPLLSLITGCRVGAAREVVLPIEGPSYSVECNYEFANCQRYAEQKCNGRYEQITLKNCPRCGKGFSTYPQVNKAVERPGYHGKLYFRCL